MRRFLFGVEMVEVSSMLKVVEIVVMGGDEGWVVVVGEMVGWEYGFGVLGEKIEDRGDNEIWFFVVGRK